MLTDLNLTGNGPAGISLVCRRDQLSPPPSDGLAPEELMTAGRARCRVLADLGIVILFLTLISLPELRNLTCSVQEPENLEKRVSAPLPPFRLTRTVLIEFPAKFEAYFNDHFGHRNSLIRRLNQIQVWWLRTSCAANVVLGRDGWLFYTVDPLGNDYRTVRPYTDAELEQWRLLLENRRDWLARRGIDYVLVVAPDKQTIYPEMLPASLRARSQGPSRLDQLITYLESHSSFRLLDVREPLRHAKSWGQLYVRTDTHWNERGAYVAYREIIESVRGRFPDLKPWPPSAFDAHPLRNPGGDLAGMLGVANQVAEEDPRLVPRRPRQAREVETALRVPNLPSWEQPSLVTEHPDRHLPHAVIFRDSFAINLVLLLSEHFRRVHYRWSYDFDFPLVEREKPDVVIQEFVERLFQLNIPAS
jgi:hypothetical protein